MNPWVPQLNERNYSLSKSRTESICNTWIKDRMATALKYTDDSNRCCFTQMRTGGDLAFIDIYKNITLFDK